MCLWANIVSWVLHVDDYVWHQNRQKGQLLCKRPGISKHAKIHEGMEIQCWTKLHNIICHLSNKSQPWPKKWLIFSPMKLHGDHLLVWDYIFWGKRKQTKIFNAYSIRIFMSASISENILKPHKHFKAWHSYVRMYIVLHILTA